MMEPWTDTDEAYHAPSAYDESRRDECERRKRRDRTELKELWKDEQKRRRRERAPLFYRSK